MRSKFLIEVKEDKISEDPDHTEEAREYYSKYYSDELGSNDFSGRRGAYRGETFISLNRTLGAILRLTKAYERNPLIPEGSEERVALILKSRDVNRRIKKKVKLLLTLYHSKANFIPLYNPRDGNSINMLKNKYYNDYPDLFLLDVQKYYEKGEIMNEIFSEENVAQYFSIWKTFESYIDGNFLQAYVSIRENGKYSVNRFSPDGMMPYLKQDAIRIKGEKRVKETYQKISIFLTDAIQIIEQRAKILESQCKSTK